MQASDPGFTPNAGVNHPGAEEAIDQPAHFNGQPMNPGQALMAQMFGTPQYPHPDPNCYPYPGPQYPGPWPGGVPPFNRNAIAPGYFPQPPQPAAPFRFGQPAGHGYAPNKRPQEQEAPNQPGKEMHLSIPEAFVPPAYAIGDDAYLLTKTPWLAAMQLTRFLPLMSPAPRNTALRIIGQLRSDSKGNTENKSYMINVTAHRNETGDAGWEYTHATLNFKITNPEAGNGDPDIDFVTILK